MGKFGRESALLAARRALALRTFHDLPVWAPILGIAVEWQAWPCMLSVLLLATAELYLDGVKGPTGHFWEELVETNGYFLFAIAAWKHVGLIGDPKFDRPI